MAKEKHKVKKVKSEHKALKVKKTKPILGQRKVSSQTKEAIIKKSILDSKINGNRGQRFKKSLLDLSLLMTREMRRVRWAKILQLNKKFWLTVGFITFFAIFFAIVQTLLQLILEVSKILVI